MALVGAAGRIGISAKSREIRGQHKVLIRDSETIGEMLGAMGATTARTEWEELRKKPEKPPHAD